MHIRYSCISTANTDIPNNTYSALRISGSNLHSSLPQHRKDHPNLVGIQHRQRSDFAMQHTCSDFFNDMVINQIVSRRPCYSTVLGWSPRGSTRGRPPGWRFIAPAALCARSNVAHRHATFPATGERLASNITIAMVQLKYWESDIVEDGAVGRGCWRIKLWRIHCCGCIIWRGRLLSIQYL